MYHKFIFYTTTTFLLLSIRFAFAENKFVLCTGYDKNGVYEGAYEDWSIQKGGNFMYLFYSSGTPINDTLFVKIDKTFDRKDTNYYEYDHYYLVPSDSKQFAVNKYTFTKTGNYKISVYDRNDSLLITPYLTNISIDEQAYNDMYFRDTWYYATSRINFFEKTIGDTMIGRNTVFAYNPNGTKVILYINQKETIPFKTRHLVSKVYTSDKCHELISTNTYYVNENWHWTFISVYFSNKGKYIVELYNDDDVFINSGSLEIK